MLASLRAKGRSAERVCSLPAAELEAETHFQVFIFKQNVQSTTLIIINICHILHEWQFMKIWCSTGSHTHGDAALALPWVSNREFLHWQHWSHNKRVQPKIFSSHSWHSVVISFCFESFFFLRHDFLWFFQRNDSSRTTQAIYDKVSHSTALMFHTYPLIPFYSNLPSNMQTKKQFQIL